MTVDILLYIFIYLIEKNSWHQYQLYLFVDCFYSCHFQGVCVKCLAYLLYLSYSYVLILTVMITQALAALIGVFVGFTLGILVVAISGTVLLWLYGSFWTTVLVIFLGGDRLALLCLLIISSITLLNT